MTYKQLYNSMQKQAAGQIGSLLAGGAYTLAAVFIALAGGTGVATGYVQNALTRPRKQDLKNIQMQHRNNRLRQDIKSSQIAMNRMSNATEEKKKSLRIV